MKKIFVAVMAMAAFVACSNEEQIAAPKGQAIAFGDAFVDNATKAIYEGGIVPNKFTVWGNVAGKGSSNIVALYGDSGASVTGTGKMGLYTCNETRYWTPDCDYNFAAIVNGTAKTVVNGLPTLISYTAKGDNDLLYAAAAAETNASGVPSGTVATVSGETTPVVAFTFKHLLSRVAFKFTVHPDLYADYSYSVENIKIAGAFATGNCTPAGVWSDHDGEMTNALTFGNIARPVATAGSVAAGAYVIIPGTPELTITFDAVCYLNGEAIKTYQYEKTVDTQIFVANHAYTFVAELPLPGKEIKFTVVDVAGFEDGGNVNVQ